MISERVLAARVGDVLQKVDAVNHTLAEALTATVDGGGLDVGRVRQLAHSLVALGGAMTSLGVELASDAHEHK